MRLQNNFFHSSSKKRFSPDITAILNASAIRIGFLARAIAEFINTPSQPNSIAIVASEAVPIPASIMTEPLTV